MSDEAPQENGSEEKNPVAAAVKAMKLRGIGPAVTGGRIAYVAVHPTDRKIWYVAVGSGGLWKTTNAGISWAPVFDDQPSYSIGAVTIDPSNPNTIWVGTGENVSGRHVAWGDGVYRSLDGGTTWKQMGLADSQHIGRILVDPRDSQTVLVAAEGPLWSAGGERGLYKTSDGGETWQQVLEIDENTGVTWAEFNPANPDVIYAAAYQRRRHIWSFLGGGPSGGIHKSMDGGETWRKVTEGLPKGDIGKIGLAVSAANPELVYATVEAIEKERGFYRSSDQGESWEKRSEYISGGTGPHYYQEIYASPSNPELIYQMDVFVHVTKNGGKTFANMEDGKHKHSDNHALWIDPDDGQHLLLGSDGGLYETFDHGTTWRHFPNMPIAQFYRMAVDNSEPFYNILGGAQDLGTLLGPSRTTTVEGVRNQDWYVPIGADGYHVQFDPNEPEITYMEYQVGNIFRYDRRLEEPLDIKPMGAPDDPPERWNWDTPIEISPHNSNRIYVASQRVWRSEDRGDSWTAISGDLTHNRDRLELEMFGRVWSVDALHDAGAMSQHATISIFCESPVQADLLYVGTDDGRIQVSEDGGETWREAGELPGVPEFSFIQDVEACQHDADMVFATALAHKTGDFSPYVFESSDRGRTWTSIRGDLPDGVVVWAIEQDHLNHDLLFIAAENGLYTSLNRGENWHKLSGGVPTISFRDMKLHRRDNDLVGATFGRGFYVLDDYSALREITSESLEAEAQLFSVRDAWWYIPSTPMQSRGMPTMGSTLYKAENPPFGAVIRYHIGQPAKTAKATRQETEKELRKNDENVPFPGWEELHAEALENEPLVWIIIRDARGTPVRRIKGSAAEGLQQVSWDLRMAPVGPIELKKPDFVSPWSSPQVGPAVAPGSFTAELVVLSDQGAKTIGEPQRFEVKALPGRENDADYAALTAFQQETGELYRQMAGVEKEIDRANNRLDHLRAALTETAGADAVLAERLQSARTELADLKRRFSGDETKDRLNAPGQPGAQGLIWRLVFGHWRTSQLPTETMKQSYAQGQAELAVIGTDLTALIDVTLAGLEADFEAAGAPWTPGRKLA
jgi:photosystem II stability/assembly factor-like uncharacterized protein